MSAIGSICLKTAHFPHPHKGVEIARAFEKLKDEFDLNDKVFQACTDNGSNVKCACNILGIDWNSCLGHDICLLVSTDLLKHEDMEDIRKLKDKMKKINKALMFKYEELRQLHDGEYNKTLYRILSELENICEYRRPWSPFILILMIIFRSPDHSLIGNSFII